MRIAVVNLTGGGLSGGYRKYLHRLLPLMVEDPRVEDLHVFLPESVRDAAPCPLARLHTWPSSDGLLGHPRLKAQIREVAPDVVFIPTARWLDCGSVPVVTMVRNMEPVAAAFGGNSLPESLKNVLRGLAARRACAGSARIIAVSSFVRDHLVDRWRVDPGRIATVRHGVDAAAPEGAQRPGSVADVQPGRFLFTAGSIRPARGLEDVIEALSRAAGPADRLVIAGRVDPGAERYRLRLDALIERLGLGERVLWAGHLKPAEMSWCYANAFAFAMTSRVEACPNVALEAMAHGCACVSTRNPPMPEFFGDAALYYDAGDAVGLARQLAHLSEMDPRERVSMITAVRRLAGGYAWEETARRTISELESVSARSLAAA